MAEAALPDVRVGAYGVIVRDGAILLTHWNEGGRTGWTLPGGGLEEREDTPTAAIREIAEETGYTATIGPLLGVDSAFVEPERRFVPNGDKALHALRVVYEATILGGSLIHEAHGTSDEARWVPLDEVGGLQLVSLVPIALGWWGQRHGRPG